MLFLCSWLRRIQNSSGLPCTFAHTVFAEVLCRFDFHSGALKTQLDWTRIVIEMPIANNQIAFKFLLIALCACDGHVCGEISKQQVNECKRELVNPTYLRAVTRLAQ